MSPLPPTGFRRLGPDKTGRNSCIPVFCLRADRGGQRMNFRIIRRAPCAILTCIAIYESLQRPMKVETEIAAGFFWEYWLNFDWSWNLRIVWCHIVNLITTESCWVDGILHSEILSLTDFHLLYHILITTISSKVVTWL